MNKTITWTPWIVRASLLRTSQIVLALVGLTGASAADLTVSPLFSDHGFLQQETVAPIWGTADPHAKVTVEFRSVSAEATADNDGKWIARLKTPKAEPGQTGTDLKISSGPSTLVLQDVVVGEIWAGSGQSNIDSSMREYAVGRDESSRANYPNIRFYNCGINGDFSKCKWSCCTPTSASVASATGYFFSRDLHQALQVPVGFLNMAVSGSPMGPFLKPDWLKADPRTASNFEKLLKEAIPVFIEDRKTRMAKWNSDVEEARTKGLPQPRRPFEGEPADISADYFFGERFTKRVLPVIPFAFRGLLWDQGEAGVAASMWRMENGRNVLYNGGWIYDQVFDIMITNWRREFGVNFPVVYCDMPKGGAWGPTAVLVTQKANAAPGEAELGAPVELVDLPAKVPEPGAPFEGFDKEPNPYSRMLALPDCHMAVDRDLDVYVHPPDKDKYGHRFYLTAINKVYGQKVECYGPMMKSAKREGDKVRVSFDHVGTGLVALGDRPLQGFSVTGKDKASGAARNVWAACQIDRDTVLLSAPELSSIELVSYANASRGRVKWANLFNQDGLPAYPMTLKVE